MLFTTSDKGGSGPIGVDPQLDPVEQKPMEEIICGNCMEPMNIIGPGKAVCPICKSKVNDFKKEY